MDHVIILSDKPVKENSVELMWAVKPQYIQSSEIAETLLIYTHIGNRTTIATSASFDTYCRSGYQKIRTPSIECGSRASIYT